MALVRDWKALESLFTRYVDGDAAAAQPLFGAIRESLSGYYRARMGRIADADDLVQTALLKIHFARDRYDPEQSLKTWVFTIASRSLIDHWRGRSAEAEVLEAEGEQPSERGAEGPGPELKTLLHRDLNQALSDLKPIDRSIVYLYGVEGLSMAEIARSLSLSEGATKLRAHRAYVEMRKKLE